MSSSLDFGIDLIFLEYFEASTPDKFPNTSKSESELPPSLFAPCIPPAASPHANRPSTLVIEVSASTLIPPIK